MRHLTPLIGSEGALVVTEEGEYYDGTALKYVVTKRKSVIVEETM